jgi:hypothetical protein
MLKAAEESQAGVPWKNFRATHSDGLCYGDIDPRFADDAGPREAQVICSLFD